MTRGAKALLIPGVVTALAFALLVTLGFWQVRRLGEKEALIARIDTRLDAPPQALPSRAQWRALAPADYDFLHVRVSGHYLPGPEALQYTRAPEGFGREPGYIVLTPFEFSDGGVALIERGFVPESKKLAYGAPSAGNVTLVGHLHAPQSRNFFTPVDAPAQRIWYTRDPAAIAAVLGIAGAAPFSLAPDPAQTLDPGQPQPAPGAPQIVNNHLSYAITWFALAGALLVVFGLFARGKLVSQDRDV
jgi:surfeit locus 1 family protein